MGRKSKRRVHRGPKPKVEPVKQRDDLADQINAQLKGRDIDAAKANTIRVLKLSACDVRNKMAEGEPPGVVCACGAVVGPKGFACRGIPPDSWYEKLLDGTLKREADDARRGDAAALV